MKAEYHKKIVEKLKCFEDIERIAKAENLPKDFLLVLLTQKISRNATTRFYRVKADVEKYIRRWDDGESIYDIAVAIDFPPILLAMLVFMKKGLSRKAFWEGVRNPLSLPDKRMRKEFGYFVLRDVVYSPIGNSVQKRRGRDGEELLRSWLDSWNIKYYIEDELRKQFPKTPDALLLDPIMVGDREVYWIESKANFGDEKEVSKNLKKQLLPYTELFGPGMVVYWYDFIKPENIVEDILIVNSSFFLHKGPGKNMGRTVKKPPYDPFEFSSYEVINEMIESLNDEKE
ncbi:MAG: TPD domain-containing protein [Thermoplasmata archaeon]